MSDKLDKLEAWLQELTPDTLYDRNCGGDPTYEDAVEDVLNKIAELKAESATSQG